MEITIKSLTHEHAFMLKAKLFNPAYKWIYISQQLLNHTLKSCDEEESI